MKIRTDFVTNSSSSSFTVFNINNPGLYDYLESIGIKFKKCKNKVIDSNTVLVLPSGKELSYRQIDDLGMAPASEYDSIANWFLTLSIGSVMSYDFDADDDDEDGVEAAAAELARLLEDDGKLSSGWEDSIDSIFDLNEHIENDVNKLDDELESAEIRYTCGGGESGSVDSEKYIFSDGETLIRTLEISSDDYEDDEEELWDRICLSVESDIDLFKMDELADKITERRIK